MTLPTRSPSGRRAAVIVLVTTVILFVILVGVALHTSAGQGWEAHAWFDLLLAREPSSPTLSVAGRMPIGLLAGAVGVCLLAGVWRREWGLVGSAAVLVVGANCTTQFLKHVVIERPDLGYGTINILPSGHTTMAASLAAALVLLTRARVLAVVIAIGATASTAVAVVAGGWHLPSDAIAALLVCAVWISLLASIRGVDRRPVNAVFVLVTVLLVSVVVLGGGLSANVDSAVLWRCVGIIGAVEVAVLAYAWVLVNVVPRGTLRIPTSADQP